MNPSIPQPPPRTKKRSFIIISSIFIIVLITGSIALAPLTAPTCLTANNYRAFYGLEPDESESFGPGKPFFSGNYSFVPDSTIVDNAESEGPEEDIEQLATFYKNNPRKQMTFALGAEYDFTIAGAKTIATKRTEILKTLLVKAGIAADSITIASTPSLLGDTRDDENTDTPTTTDSVLLTLASSSSCRE